MFSPYDPMILDIHNCHYPRSACPPGSPIYQLLLRHLLSHSHALDSPSSKFQIVPSRTNDLHKPLRAVEFASACRLPMSALPNSHLRAGCQCLCCRIPRQPQFSSAYSPLTSFAAWLGHSIVQPMFVNNLRCRFSFDEPTAAQIRAADLCPCRHGCQHP
jgi:hypothetical protein